MSSVVRGSSIINVTTTDTRRKGKYTARDETKTEGVTEVDARQLHGATPVATPGIFIRERTRPSSVGALVLGRGVVNRCLRYSFPSAPGIYFPGLFPVALFFIIFHILILFRYLLIFPVSYSSCTRLRLLACPSMYSQLSASIPPSYVSSAKDLMKGTYPL